MYKRIFKELGFGVTAIKSSDVNVDFKIYCPEENFGINTYEKFEVYAHGNVKFDGCSNWTFDEQERGLCLHGCKRADVIALGLILGECWDMAKEMLDDKFIGRIDHETGV